MDESKNVPTPEATVGSNGSRLQTIHDKDSLRQKLLLLVVDKGLLALIFGIALVTANSIVTRSLEETKSELAYSRVIAERRSQALADLWASLLEYGLDLKAALTGGEISVVSKSSKKFDDDLISAGVYLGAEKVRELQRKIGGEFLRQLTEAVSKDNASTIEPLLNEFQSDWTSSLEHIEKEIYRIPADGK